MSNFQKYCKRIYTRQYDISRQEILCRIGKIVNTFDLKKNDQILYVENIEESKKLLTRKYTIINDTTIKYFEQYNNKDIFIQQKIKERTRNLSKCMATEHSVPELLKKLIESGDSITFPKLEGNFKVIRILKKLGKQKSQRDVKNDTRIEIQNIETKEKFKVGIQTKGHNYTFVENWSDYKKIKNINEKSLIWLKTIVKENRQEFIDKLKLYIRRKNCGRAKFVKFGLCVEIKKKSNTEITDFDLKKHFLKRHENDVDHFYYYVKPENKSVCVDDFQYVDDNFIRNKKLYWCFRPIYTSSGKTQLGQNNIFAYDMEFSNQIKDIINNSV